MLHTCNIFHRLWGTPSFLWNEYWGFFPRR